MIRQIEFRGKRLIEGEWVYGDFYRAGLYSHIMPPEAVYVVRVDSATIGQYTGLTLRNGQKVFEHDIVKDKHGNVGVVEYSSKCLEWQISFHNQQRRITPIDEEILPDFYEVLGNIHDNPGLLEEAAQND